MNIDGLIPHELTADIEERRKARLIIYATVIGCLAAVLIFLLLSSRPNGTGVGGLTPVIPLLITYAVLLLSKSTKIAANFFLMVTASALVVAFRIEGSYSLLGVIVLPIAATHLLGIRAGAVWTVLGASWAAFAGPLVFSVDTYDSGLSISVAVMTIVVGLASIIVEAARVRAAWEAVATLADLTAERSRTRKVVEHVFPGLIDLDGTRIIYAGPGIAELVGYAAEEVLDAELMDFIHPEDVPRMQQWVDSPSPVQSIEIRLRHKDGRWVWIKNYYIPSSPLSGRQLRTFAGYDVTLEREERERSIQAQRLEGIGVLAAGVAHDFNNLLTVITGFAELMEESSSRKNILSAADDASTLVHKLMAFGKSRAVDAGATDVTELVWGAEQVLSSLLAPAVRLHISAAEQSFWVPLSASQLNQLLLNLVTNAKEALVDGGNVWIDLQAVGIANDDNLATGEYVQISVSDDGPGMDPHTLQHAFDPFYTTKSDRSGTGLGLTSVYGIARHAGGSARIDTQPGSGTTVALYLPLCPPEAHSLLETDTVDFTQGQGTILVVEDDELIADLIARSLVQAGYSVTIKNDVESAWRHLQADVPELLVTDIMMPDGRGTDLARRLHEIGSDLPILFISGYSDQEIGEWKDAAGHVKFLAKPFRAKELLDRVGQLMGARRSSS